MTKSLECLFILNISVSNIFLLALGQNNLSQVIKGPLQLTKLPVGGCVVLHNQKLPLHILKNNPIRHSGLGLWEDNSCSLCLDQPADLTYKNNITWASLVPLDRFSNSSKNCALEDLSQPSTPSQLLKFPPVGPSNRTIEEHMFNRLHVQTTAWANAIIDLP